MIGIRAGARAGLRCGLAAGISADDEAAVASGGAGIPGVTRDAASQWYFPASAAEWTALMSAAGLATGNPVTTHNCQEASGALVDAFGLANLAASGAGHLYAQSVAGFTRLAVTTVDATAGQKWLNTTTAPDPNLVSTLWLAAIRFPAVAPAANRDLMANAGTLDCRLNASGKIAFINGATTAGTANPLGGVHLVAVQHNLTATTFTGFTDQEKVVGTFAVNTTNPMFVLGGQTTIPGDVGYLWEAEFSGAAAELTSAQMKTLFQTLTGIVIPWS